MDKVVESLERELEESDSTEWLVFCCYVCHITENTCVIHIQHFPFLELGGRGNFCLEDITYGFDPYSSDYIMIWVFISYTPLDCVFYFGSTTAINKGMSRGYF